MSDLVSIAHYPNIHQAHLIRIRLEEEGIPAFVSNENAAYLGFFVPSGGGVRVLVRPEDAERARSIVAAVDEEVAAERRPPSTPPNAAEAPRSRPRRQVDAARSAPPRLPLGQALRSYRRPFAFAGALFIASAVGFYFAAPAYLERLAQEYLALSRMQERLAPPPLRIRFEIPLELSDDSDRAGMLESLRTMDEPTVAPPPEKPSAFSTAASFCLKAGLGALLVALLASVGGLALAIPPAIVAAGAGMWMGILVRIAVDAGCDAGDGIALLGVFSPMLILTLPGILLACALGFRLSTFIMRSSRGRWLKEEVRRQGKAFFCAVVPFVLLGIVCQATVLGLMVSVRTDGDSAPASASYPPYLRKVFESFREPVAESTAGEEELPRATIETDRGKMEAVLYEKDAPATVARFVDLARRGFYDGLPFHRIVPGFCVQAGRSKDSDVVDRLAPLPDEEGARRHLAGAVGMARSPLSGEAREQFYIVTVRAPHLDGEHTVFGRVTEGLDIVKQIREGDLIRRIAIERPGAADARAK